MDVSIVIPIYNSADLIEETIKEIAHVMDPLALDYELLLRDDGSRDHSKMIIEQMSYRYRQIRSFSNLSNEGLGSTLRKLIHDAQGEHIIYCDCDLPFGRDVFPVLIDKLESYDMVIASRYCGTPNYVPFVRRLCSRMYYVLCKMLFRIPVVDIGSGSVGMKKEAFEKLDLTMNGFGIHAEMYIRAQRKGLFICEFPIESVVGEQRSFSVYKHGPGILFETFQLWMDRARLRACRNEREVELACEEQKSF